MGILTMVSPANRLRDAFDLRRVHRALGLTALGLTVLAVLTGIMDRLPQGMVPYVVVLTPLFIALCG